MNKFAKTSDGKIWIVFSDNTETSSYTPNTMDLIPQNQWKSEHGGYDAEYISCSNYPYEEIECADYNLAVVLNYQIKAFKCYDCGSTIPNHHTPLCDLSGPYSILDLPEVEGTQWWDYITLKDGTRITNPNRKDN